MKIAAENLRDAIVEARLRSVLENGKIVRIGTDTQVAAAPMRLRKQASRREAGASYGSAKT